jgi:hypothetical protein
MDPEGVLRRLTEHTWAGWLGGYRVQVFRSAGLWSAWVGDARGHGAVSLPAESLADGARRARAWVEAHPPP